MNNSVTQWGRLPCSTQLAWQLPNLWSDLKLCLVEKKCEAKVRKDSGRDRSPGQRGTGVRVN